ncbi:MAG: hypothetical protein WCI67_21725, partial [Chloroflexales bacterium]
MTYEDTYAAGEAGTDAQLAAFRLMSAPPAGDGAGLVAALLLALRVAAEELSERELGTADAETRAALAGLG